MTATVGNHLVRYLATFAEGMRHADDLTLRLEAERLAAQEPFPVVRSMRKIVDEIQTTRQEADGLRAFSARTDARLAFHKAEESTRA